MSLFEHKLDERANTHINKVLEYGSELSKSILCGLNFRDGRAFTYLPSHLSDSEIYNFSQGGLLTNGTITKSIKSNQGSEVILSPVLSLDSWVSKYISFFLDSENSYAIVEDVLAEPNDPHIKRLFDVPMIFGDEIYFFLDSNNSSHSRVEEIVRATHLSWHFLCCLCSNSDQNNPQKAVEIDKLDFDAVTREVEKIIVGAYDGEGFLVWEKR